MTSSHLPHREFCFLKRHPLENNTPLRRPAAARACTPPPGRVRRRGKGLSRRQAAAYLGEHFLQLALRERHGGGCRPPPQRRQRREPASAWHWWHFRAGTAPPGSTARYDYGPARMGQRPPWRRDEVPAAAAASSSVIKKGRAAFGDENHYLESPTRTPGLFTLG